MTVITPHRNLSLVGSNDHSPAPGAEGGWLAADLKRIAQAFFRHRWMVVGIMAGAILLAMAYLYNSEPVYRGSATLQVEQTAAKALDNGEVEPVVNGWDIERFLQTQVDIMRSRGVAERVMIDEGLAEDGTFVEAVTGLSLAEMEIEAGSDAHRSLATDLLMGGLGVNLPADSRIVTLSYDSPDPVLSADIANGFADAVMMTNLERRFDTTAYSRAFLEERLGEAKQRLEQSERELLDYARANRLVEVGDAGEGRTLQSLNTGNLVRLNESFAAAQAERLAAEQRWNQVAGADLMSLSEVLANDSIARLTSRRAELSAEYQEQLERRNEAHPAVRQAAARIAELDREIETLALSVKSSIREKYEVARASENALRSRIEQLKDVSLSEQGRGVRYNILKREADTNRAMYDAILQRYKEVSAAAGNASNNIMLIDRARPSHGPVAPVPSVIFLVALVLGMGAAAGMVWLREFFNDRIRNPEDLEKRLGLALVGTVPVAENEADPRLSLADPTSTVAEAYQSTRSMLALSSSEGMPSSLTITSSVPSEGKSLSAFAIARSHAQLGKRVLMIDADMRRPSQHKLFDLPNDAGLSNYLAGEDDTSSLISKSKVKGLDVMLSGPTPPNPSELLSGARIRTLLEQLGSQYDLVIIDSPPVLGLADAQILSSNVEATLFAIQADRATYSIAGSAIKRLRGGRARMVGALLTKYAPEKGSSGYGNYGYEYYRYGNANAEGPRLAAERIGGFVKRAFRRAA